MKQSGCKILMVGDRRLVTSVSTIRSQYLSEATKMKPAQSMTLRQSAGLPSLSEMYSATCLRMISMPVNMWLRLFPGNVFEVFPQVEMWITWAVSVRANTASATPSEDSPCPLLGDISF